MMPQAVVVENLTKSFKLKTRHGLSGTMKDFLRPEPKKRLKAIDGLSFEVSQGEMFGIIGLNGSGKTTLLRIISGLYSPDSGKVVVKGRMAPLLHIGTGLQRELTAYENIIISGMLLGMQKQEIEVKAPKIMEFAELEDFSYMKLKHYSTGMRARLAFSIALQVDPDILLVDEILSVGDINFRQKSLNQFLEFKNQGKTILYSTHNLGMLSKICDRVLLIDHGKAIMIGKPGEVIQKYKELSSN